MRKHLFLLFLLLSAGLFAQKRAKYVFYFIGDGMGVNQVCGTETYYAALDGRIGIEPLCFPSFPHAGLVNTQSAFNGVTDSAAGGTALACGEKTKNGALGLSRDLQTAIYSVAADARRHGAAVGITTSVSIDHATPAAFYAHRPSREMYHEIGHDLIAAGFDFYAGSDFRKPTSKDCSDDLYQLSREAGYTLVRGYADFLKKQKKAKKMILLQSEEASRADRTCLPYAIDRTESDLTLCDITQAAISFLERQKKDGFFLMVEGGKIDYAAHINDAGTCFRELKDMDDAVRIAYAFYERHPDETLIVVSADHETGGIVLGRGPYELRLDILRHQKMSADRYTSHIAALRDSLGSEGFTWEAVQADIRENWGLGGAIELKDRQTERLQRAWKAFADGTAADHKTLYSQANELAHTVRAVMQETALVSWPSGGHSDGYVPVFAVGVGAERFGGRIDNTLIAPTIRAIAGWE